MTEKNDSAASAHSDFKNALLEKVRRSVGEWIPRGRIMTELHATWEAVTEAAQSLVREGYLLQVSEMAGLRFQGAGEGLVVTEIACGIRGALVGSRIIVLKETASTNDVAWKEALSGAPEGTVVFAEEQLSGRGRMGRQWFCPAGTGLLFSIILRPDLPAQQGNYLTVMASVAVAQAIRENLQLHARIRWPNDIMIKERKVAGILVEGRTLATGGVFVIGIGVNVTSRSEDFPPYLREIATSLAMERGDAVNRNEAAVWLLKSLDRWYRDLRFGDYGRIARSWRHFSSTMGERVVLLENGREFRGRVLDVSMEEGLIVRLDSGVTRIFNSSTVTLRQM